MGDQSGHHGRFSFLGGMPCLDFANTADWHASDHPVERLIKYQDLVAWSVESGFLPESLARRLLRKASRSTREAADVLSRAIALRESIYSIFSAIAGGSEPDADALGVLNGTLSGTRDAGVVPTTKGFAWDWIGREDALGRRPAGLPRPELRRRVRGRPRVRLALS
jgi:predicted RNA-binding Zn ribbon-like protein